MDFLKKIQDLPESQRKLILWSVVIVLGSVLFILWAINVGEKLQNFQRVDLKEQFQLPEFPKIEMPAFELPEISEEELKALEDVQ